ncbi:MAG TPA: fasciclin domain-containing protein [Chitinophagaceae bacterium]|nr:fasciclin domain-containing protein [Chitinophagaceae bacterium]
MKKFLFPALAAVFFTASAAAQEKTVMVGGAAMYPSKNIVQNALNSKDHTTLVAAVKAAGLVDALQGDGPFTVFAPTNAAFEKLPAGTVDNLLKTENKSTLQGVLKYHVVSGKWDAVYLKKMISENNGKATIETLAGGKLYASLDEKGDVWIWDENGGKAKVTIANVFQKNGVIHVVDGVLLPKM